MSGIARFKACLVVALGAPLAWLAWRISLEAQAPGSGLGADPAEAVVHFLGEWSLIVLLAAFAVTPLRRLTGSQLLGRSRRLVGIFAFAYVCLHILSYTAFYLEFSLAALFEDFIERPYITAGMAAFAFLFVMALTSTRGWQRRLRQRWRTLHRGIYLALPLALVHLWWLTRDGFGELLVFTAVFLVLAAERLYRWRAGLSRARAAQPPLS